MFPWLRLLHVGAPALIGRRTTLLDPTRVALHVWPNDLDANLHVNNGRYLALADLGRIDWFLRSQVLRQARARGALPVVADALAKFRRELKVFQAFTIETRLLGWEKRCLFLEHRFMCEGSVIGVVAARIVLRAGRRSLEPDSFLRQLNADQPSPALPVWVSHWNAGSEALAQQLRDEERGRLQRQGRQPAFSEAE